MLSCYKPWESDIVAAICRMKPMPIRVETVDVLTLGAP